MKKILKFLKKSLIFDLGDLILPSKNKSRYIIKKEYKLFWNEFDSQISKIISILLAS